jgi:PIN domain nuclease of toxin-antitoxin system
MDLILDTHALVWLLIGNERLGQRQAEIIENSSNRIFVSAVSGHEIANKFRTGKMPEAGPVLKLVKSEFAEFDWHHLPVTLQHAPRAGSLSGEHRDPYDRMLAAQAILEGYRIVTVDPAFKAFWAEVVW